MPRAEFLDHYISMHCLQNAEQMRPCQVYQIKSKSSND